MYNSVKSLGNNCFLLSVLVALLLPFGIVRGQGHDFNALKKEYPMLMERYGDRLESRNAHYIFAIDISSSMREYENVVRQSLVTFVNAVPEGDQITLIAMCDENNTNYINSIKCITINQTVRQSIVQTVESPQFKFLRERDANDGSDGFTMTRKVLDAMNVVNSSDMTFVYLLTDFEYWTHKNKYNKNNENWGELKVLLTDKHKGMMCKYGIELNCDKVSHPEAIFKPELDDIFGPLDYQQANSAVILAQWFEHIINDICAHKINAMLKADWKDWLQKSDYRIEYDGFILNIVGNAPETDLVSTYTVELKKSNISQLSTDGYDDSQTLGIINASETFFPSMINIDSSDVDVVIHYKSPYEDEIKKLQGLCSESQNSIDAVNFDQQRTLVLPAKKIWNSMLPIWLWGVIIAIVLLVIVSVVLKYIQKPQHRFTNFEVRRKAAGGSRQYNGDTQSFPYSIGSDGNLVIPGATWKLMFVTKRYNPILNPFRKTGYYVKLESGDFANIINDIDNSNIDTIQIGQTSMLFRYKKTPMIRIEIAEGSTNNIIYIS